MSEARRILRVRFPVVWAALALAACSADAPAEQAQHSPAPAAAPKPASLYGLWRIVEVNGAPARAFSAENQPSLSFGPDRFGGSSGCNSFGGNGLLVGDRWFAEPPMATQQGCGELDRQERAIFDLVAGGPRIALQGADGALLRTVAGSLRLRRIGPAPATEGSRPGPLIAGTGWELTGLDGGPIGHAGLRELPRLTFEADRWTLDTGCGSRTGGWRQLEGAVLIEPGTAAASACPAERARSGEALAKALSGRLHYVVGPNGEFVLSDGRHWLTGRRDMAFGAEDRHLLLGRWRILSVDGAWPLSSERPAELAFGPGYFGVWDGCMHSEGVAIVSERQLFTHPSGMVTMANCPEDPIRRKINAVVGTSPRLARTADGLALISAAGSLRLQRSSARAFGTGVSSRLQPGLAFDLLAGLPSPARLLLAAPDRFTVTLPCGTFEGRWRNTRSKAGDHARFGPERPPACESRPEAMRLYNFFTGDVEVVIGPNRDIALFVSRGEALRARLSR